MPCSFNFFYSWYSTLQTSPNSWNPPSLSLALPLSLYLNTSVSCVWPLNSSPSLFTHPPISVSLSLPLFSSSISLFHLSLSVWLCHSLSVCLALALHPRWLLCQEEGPYQNYTRSWSFHSEQSECARFWYGGCGGNQWEPLTDQEPLEPRSSQNHTLKKSRLDIHEKKINIF
jgi:hypothetical protein